MSKVALDLSQWKHVKSDKSTTTLQHKDGGHSLVINHKALSPESQAQLSALSKVAQDVSTPLQSDEAKSQKMADGGDVDEYGYPKQKENVSSEQKQDAKQFTNSVGKSYQGVQDTSGYEPTPKSTPPSYAKGGDVQRSSMPPKMYADGANPVGSDDTTDPTSGYQTPDLPTAQDNANIDQELSSASNSNPAKIEAEFNNLLMKRRGESVRSEDPDLQPKAPQAPPQPQDNRADEKTLYNQKLAASGSPYSADDMFGPNGEPPKNPVNPVIWGQVQNSNAAQRDVASEIASRKAVAAAGEATQRQEAEHEKAVAQNAVNQQLGIPLVPDPGAPVTPETAQQAAGDVNPPQEQPAPNQPPQNAGGMGGGSTDPESLLNQGYRNAMAGITQEGAAKGQLGQAQAQVLQQQVEAQHEAQSRYQQHYQDLENERQNFIKDIQNGYIDPDKYWDNHSKLAAGIGIILAGFNPTNRPNAALEMLHNQMEQNLQAQAKNLGVKQSLLETNLRQFGNLRDATDMTRIMQADIVKNQLDQAAAKATNPMAKAAAQQASGQLQMSVAPQFQQFAMRRAFMQLANGGAQNPQATEQMLNMMQMVNPEQAKEMRSRYVPGYSGLSPVPVPDKARENLQARAQLDAAAKDLYRFAATHTGSLSPSDIAVGKQKAQLLQSLYREGVLNTVYREGEQPLLDKVVNSDPTSFFNSISTLPKLKEIIHGNDMGRSVLAKQYNLTPPQGAPIDAGEIKTLNGVKYQRVQGGWKKVK